MGCPGRRLTWGNAQANTPSTYQDLPQPMLLDLDRLIKTRIVDKESTVNSLMAVEGRLNRESGKVQNRKLPNFWRAMMRQRESAAWCVMQFSTREPSDLHDSWNQLMSDISILVRLRPRPAECTYKRGEYSYPYSRVAIGGKQ